MQKSLLLLLFTAATAQADKIPVLTEADAPPLDSPLVSLDPPGIW